MTGVAGRIRQDVAVRPAANGIAIVTARTSTRDTAVIKRNGSPINLRDMAGVAGCTGLNMVVGFSSSRAAIMATCAGSGDARVIEVYRLPCGL